MADVLQQAGSPAEGRFDDAEGSSTETAWAYDEPYDDDGGDDDAYDEAADAMEVAEMGERFGSAVRLAPMTKSHAASNAAEGAERKANRAKNTGLTRDERATTEQVLDPRTRLLLFKLLNAGTLSSINGCVSTGKEANVYHAEGRDGEYAIKVYKTSILIFKDRDRCDHARAAAPSRPAPGPLSLSLSLGLRLPGAPSPSPSPSPGPSPHQVRERRVPLPSRLLQVQPAQDGAHVGGEGDAQLPAARRGGRALPRGAPAQGARAAHALHRHGWLGGAAPQGRCAQALREDLRLAAGALPSYHPSAWRQVATLLRTHPNPHPHPHPHPNPNPMRAQQAVGGAASASSAVRVRVRVRVAVS